MELVFNLVDKETIRHCGRFRICGGGGGGGGGGSGGSGGGGKGCSGVGGVKMSVSEERW